MEGLLKQIVPVTSATDSRLGSAQQVMYEAFEATSPQRQVALARKALKISPDCADAYVLLAEYAETLPEAMELYEQGLAAGARALGDEGFEEYEGHFWGFLETRPYMRARQGLANCLWAAGRREEAAEHCREMLRLNPNDNQGIRYRLASMLLDLERHNELEGLLETFKDDGSAEWAYTRALLAFRTEGDSSRARKALVAATKVNAHVPAYLARVKPMPRHAPEYITFGGEDEAVSYAAQFLPAWKETPNAAAWLRSTLKISPIDQPMKKRETWSKLRPALSRLPQCEDETWEVDLRHVPASLDSEGSSQWMVVALNTTRQQVVRFEFFDNRPKDAEVWGFLLAAMGSPHDGQPGRPEAVCVARKTWFRSWQPKLKDIGIECRFDESLVQIDQWFDTALPELEEVQQIANDAAPEIAEWSKLTSLPQRAAEVWQADVQHLPAWVQGGEAPTRPWMSLVADVESDVILATEISTAKTSDELLLNGIWHALSSPAVGDAHRPGVIQVASEQQREILARHLERVDVRCVANSDLQRVRRIMTELVDHLEGQQQRTALIHSPGVTIAQVGSLFEAAERFYRARPWRQVPGDCVLRVACEQFDSGPWYAVVMGQSGIEQGLALYEDAQLLHSLLTGQLSDDEGGRRTSAISVTYGEAFEVASDDLDAAEKHGWPVAGPEAYPCVLRVNPGMALRTPLKWELELLESCLRSIPDFLTSRDGKAKVSVTVASGTFGLELEQLEEGGRRR